MAWPPRERRCPHRAERGGGQERHARVATEIVEASPEKPYLARALNIDFRIVSQLMLDDGMPAETAVPYRRAMAISGTNLPLLNAFNRLLDLFDEPANAPVLAPLAQREILFRLLISEQGPFLR